MADRPSAWDEWFSLECQFEIASSERNWSLALTSIEKLVDLERKIGFYVNMARSLLAWADTLLRTGEPANLELAQPIAGEALEDTSRMGVVLYQQVAERLLGEIRRRSHAETVDHAQLTSELKRARQVQESLLPENPPTLPGWELEVSLLPAHETSGDFYDFLSLPDGRLGLVVADVTDKGTGAALYMALGRSLWRTFALNHPEEPELTLAETNHRILEDTHGGLFITLFYAILDPREGWLSFCNAGHLPGFLVRSKDGTIERLERTGIPLGIFGEASWERKKVRIETGDRLVLYTDGITDAQNVSEELYDMDRLQATIKQYRDQSAKALRDDLLEEVRQWQGSHAQSDDITLMVLAREA